ncbi:Clp protease N-terminal domain-containing protein [Pseudofrankia sp. BMG5.37]|uniref:Clp protease N-terminal domain-containing protein n=1 Tax=Pseudofrankia sp. BMG5.37 TaxID=3050035 RepID=UPI002893BB19|nr:Clp protease N-terminal domain-containing protein [Pseudofrankia sp. BMG5.37]MDT3445161.1 Clp protease N-terminal domain-containing protein [Pseudofrankia sp. BMG5.37]
MFSGDHPELSRAVGRAMALARGLGHARVGSEHLLLALATGDGAVSAVLVRHGTSAAVLREAVLVAAPAGAGVAVDRDTLATLGVDVDGLLRLAGTGVRSLDRPPLREPLLPLGAAAARRRCARMSPPLGLDAQAAYEASLRLALARRERAHRPEHLALALGALDPGAAWVLASAGIDRHALVADLAATFPPPRRNALFRAERQLGRRTRGHDLIRRYERTTGRTATAGGTVAVLIDA